MRKVFQSAKWSIYILIPSALLAGCVSIVKLPDGQTSAMGAESNSLRAQLIINPTPLPTALAYKPVVSCLYRETRTPFGKPTVITQGQLSVRRVRDRYLVTSREEGRTSTALIGPHGKLYDFNLVDSNNERATTQTYNAEVDRKLAELNATGDPRVNNAHVVNDFAVLIPDFAPNPRYPGDTAAVVLDEGNNDWAVYRYRGLTQVAGTTAAVLDLTRTFPDNPEIGPSLVGFDVIDLRTMLPVLVVLDAGIQVKLESLSCSR